MDTSPRNVQATPVWIALGSNLGDRIGKLRFAVEELFRTPDFCIRRASSVYETPPVGPPGQGPYLNAVVVADTHLGPHQLLATLQRIERDAGRQRTGQRNEARVLDLDLLAYGAARIHAPDLVIPHPRMHLRDFVLVPLHEVDPGWKHPGSGTSVETLLEALPEAPAYEVRQGETLWPLPPSACPPSESEPA